jgi:hypothetical protein
MCEPFLEFPLRRRTTTRLGGHSDDGQRRLSGHNMGTQHLVSRKQVQLMASRINCLNRGVPSCPGKLLMALDLFDGVSKPETLQPLVFDIASLRALSIGSHFFSGAKDVPFGFCDILS